MCVRQQDNAVIIENTNETILEDFTLQFSVSQRDYINTKGRKRNVKMGEKIVAWRLEKPPGMSICDMEIGFGPHNCVCACLDLTCYLADRTSP